MNQETDRQLYGKLVIGTSIFIWILYERLSTLDFGLLTIFAVGLFAIVLAFYYEYFSKNGREAKKRAERIAEIPENLLKASEASIYLGHESDLRLPIFLPDKQRCRHVHIIGATGSGKTESVIMNFIKQDVERGLGCVILDAKGDISFVNDLKSFVSTEKLRIFDLSEENSLAYNPLEAGSPLEAAQRLFASLTWSEEYYKSRALTALQKIFQYHFTANGKNPTLLEVGHYLESAKSYAAIANPEDYPEKQAEKDFSDLMGLRDQVKTLCTGHLAKILSPVESQVDPSMGVSGLVLYFRLQSLLSSEIVSVVGKLLVNHLSYLAGTAHRRDGNKKDPGIVPIYLDEFASFACTEFADLISKARSAGFALHFSHQSTGDVAEVSKGFLNQITDNSCTKIVMRINDPDSAEFFARSFGTSLTQKFTQRVTNAKETDRAEVMGDASLREVHQFRAAPDLFKTLPTGAGSVLIAHGQDTPHGASSVFKIKFPKLERKEKE